MRRIPIIVNTSLTVSNAVKEKIFAATVPLAATGITARHFGSTASSSLAPSRLSSSQAAFASAPADTRLFVGKLDAIPSFSSSTIGSSHLFRRTAGTAMSIPVAELMMKRRDFATSQKNLVKTSGKDQPDAAKAGEPNALQGVHNIQEYKEEEEQKYEEEQQQENPNNNEGYLPFPAPFNTINIIMILFIANCLCYVFMNWIANDDMRDFAVEHFTLSHENWWKIYPIFTHAFYQEQLLQLLIDNWLLCQFGRSTLAFLGGRRLAVFWALTCIGGAAFHVGRQYFELYYGHDPLEVRGRCYGPNPFILGLVGVEGLIFRHLNFMQSPPVPFLVMTAFVMIIDVWRIFTTKPEEHGSPTGGALMAYVFWALPTRMLGLSRLTAAI